MASSKIEPEKVSLFFERSRKDGDLHHGNQKVLVRMILLLEPRDKTEAGTEHHHDAAGEHRVPHVGDLHNSD